MNKSSNTVFVTGVEATANGLAGAQHPNAAVKQQGVVVDGV